MNNNMISLLGANLCAKNKGLHQALRRAGEKHRTLLEPPFYFQLKSAKFIQLQIKSIKRRRNEKDDE